MDKKYIEGYLSANISRTVEMLDQINIGGTLYEFEERVLYKNIFSILLPKNFTVLEEEKTKLKYPSVNHPEIIYTNENASISFTFTHTDIPIDNEQIRECILGFRTVLKRMHPSYMFRKINMIPLENNIVMGQLKYTSLAMDGDVFNMLYIMPILGTLLIGTFSCESNDRERLTMLMNKVVYSIKEVSYEEALEK